VKPIVGKDPAKDHVRCPGPGTGFHCGWEGTAAEADCPPEGGLVRCPRCGTPVETDPLKRK
jgi:hypothetical protein